MSTSRFVALIASCLDARCAWERLSASTFSDSSDMEKHVVGDRLVLISEVSSTLAVGSEGFVVGKLFSSGKTEAVKAFDAATARSIVTSHGDRLIDAHWGSYVAVLAARQRPSVELIRAPLGDLPCYTWLSPFGLLAASDVDLLTRFGGFEAEIDWAQLALDLAAPDLRRPRTCLAGLNELSGGERLTDLAARRVIDVCWTPWNYAGSAMRFSDPIEAAYRVRHAVNTSVAAQATDHPKALLRLSGGLDSSILAAALKQSNVDFVAHTLVTRDRGGDERLHARKVADHLGIQLIEVERNCDFVDVGVSAAQGLPRPSARAFAQASSRSAREAARACNASVILDGGGGDNVFASLQSTAPVADCLRADGGVGHFWKTARSIGIAAHESTYKVARGAIIRSLTRGPDFRWPIDLNLLSASAQAAAATAGEHPWLSPPRGALPGSASHVALIVGAQSVVQSRDPRERVPDVSPLISQPVVETCLRVPSWMWTRDGHNRAIAREAFRSLLPASIVYRRDKGAPDSFLVELIAANLDRMRGMLLHGCLARNGLLDTIQVDAALALAARAKGFGYIRIMQLIDAEAWVQSWMDGR